MHPWHDVRASRVTPDRFLALIEISKASKNKYELDKETGHLILDRVLFTSTHYPQNYGFIPRTYARDYDPLDVLVLCSESIIPMSFVEWIYYWIVFVLYISVENCVLQPEQRQFHSNPASVSSFIRCSDISPLFRSFRMFQHHAPNAMPLYSSLIAGCLLFVQRKSLYA